MAKFTRGAIGNMTKHFERGVNSKGEPVNYKNQEIDLARSRLNYNLAPVREEGQVGFIEKMVGSGGKKGEVYCMNRKDVNVMCSWIVTLPKSFPEDRSTEFFEKTYEFLKDRYDPQEKNVVSAYVHMDETTPHLHYAFIPVVADKKHGAKVRASSVINRMDLQRFHGDLQNSLEKHFGFKVEIQNDATKDGNKSIDELKRLSAPSKLQEAQKSIKTANTALESIKKDIDIEKGILKSMKDMTTGMAKASDLSVKRPDYLDVVTEKQGPRFHKKTVEYAKVPLEKWDDKHVSADRVSTFERHVDDLVKSIDQKADKVNALQGKINDLMPVVNFFQGLMKASPVAQREAEQYQQQLISQKKKHRQKTKSNDLERGLA